MDTNNEQPVVTPADTLAALLGTADTAQQIAVVQRLNAPAISVSILFDGRVGIAGISSVPPMEAVDVIELLAAAQSFLVGQMKQVQKRAQQAA
jgi:hypothetical protein